MKLIRGLYNLRPEHRGGVATIGNFDGIHRGHQAVMRQLHAQAERLKCHTTVITFEPLPHESFLGANSPARLTPLCEKLNLLEETGIEQVLCLPFNKSLAGMPAKTFIDRVLVEGLGIQHLVVGDDFRFGHGRRGDFAMLVAAGKQHGFDVIDTHTFVCDEDCRISSTRIREALALGDMATAEHLLGRPFTMSGRVIHGEKRGRQLGFPTANIAVHRPVSPLRGVFAVKAEGIGSSVANVGTRPTFDGKGFLIEVHLLDFSGDLYRQRLKIHWLKRLRGEQRFASLEALTRQIKQDIKEARAFFAEAHREDSFIEPQGRGDAEKRK